MTWTKLPAVFLLVAGSTFPLTTQTLVGTWKLFSYTDTSPGGMPWFPFGTPPYGQFVFTADGHFSAGIECNPDTGSVPDNLPVPEFDDLTRPYMGYFGTYRFDPATSTVTFDVAGASAPSYVGSTVSSQVRFSGNQMIMTGTSVRKNGHTWTWQRILTRE